MSRAGRDYEILVAKLDLEKTLLLQWADRIRLLKTGYDSRLDEPATSEALSRILANIRNLLCESTSLQTKYGLTSEERLRSHRPHHDNAFSREVLPSTVSRARMMVFTNEFSLLQVRAKEPKKSTSTSAKTGFDGSSRTKPSSKTCSRICPASFPALTSLFSF